MTTHDSAHTAIAASLDVAHVQKLAQLSDEAFWNFARNIAGMGTASLTSPDAAVTPEQLATEEEYLECAAAQSRFLLALSGLYEILPPPRHYTELPGNPPWMPGLAAWRGSAIAVVDLALYLTGETHNEQEYPLPRCLLIAHAGDISLGLLVHSDGSCFPLQTISSQDAASYQGDAVSEETQTALADTSSTGDSGWWLPERVSLIAAVLLPSAMPSAVPQQPYRDALTPVLDIPALLTDIVRQLENATTNG